MSVSIAWMQFNGNLCWILLLILSFFTLISLHQSHTTVRSPKASCDFVAVEAFRAMTPVMSRAALQAQTPQARDAFQELDRVKAVARSRHVFLMHKFMMQECTDVDMASRSQCE